MQEAIDLANDSSFGLVGCIFTKDEERGMRIANQIDTGMIFLNYPTASQIDLSFGGSKRSGYGRALSPLGTAEFVNRKLIRTSNIPNLYK